MAVLVLADHQDGALTQPTRSTVAAAAKLGDVHVLIAGGAIFITVSVFNLAGEGFRDALDPKLRR